MIQRLFISTRLGLLTAMMTIATSAIAGTGPPCVTDATALCLNGRFSVRLSWSMPQGLPDPPHSQPQAAAAVTLSDSAGYFWFFEPSNVEFVVKVLDGCALNHAWWVFGTSLTSLPWTLEVADTITGDSFTYPGAGYGLTIKPYVQETNLFSGSCP